MYEENRCESSEILPDIIDNYFSTISDSLLQSVTLKEYWLNNITYDTEIIKPEISLLFDEIYLKDINVGVTFEDENGNLNLCYILGNVYSTQVIHRYIFSCKYQFKGVKKLYYNIKLNNISKGKVTIADIWH